MPQFMYRKYSSEVYNDHMNRKTKESFPDGHEPVKLDQTPMLFITGFYRSGTTFLYSSLHSILPVCSVTAFDILYYHRLLSDWKENISEKKKEAFNTMLREMGCVNRYIDYMPAKAESLEEYAFILSQQGSNSLEKENFDLFEEMCQKILLVNGSDINKGLLLKNPADCGNELMIHNRYPQAKFIFISRNPIHILNSFFKALTLRFRTEDAPWSPYLFTCMGLDPKFSFKVIMGILGLVGACSLFVRLAKLLSGGVASSFKKIEKSFSQMPEDSYITISYETFMEHPQRELTRISEMVGISPDASVLSQIKTSPRPVSIHPAVKEAAPHLKNLMVQEGTWQDRWDEAL
eukprot:CAMPEP_0206209838 /NCGR_PEP_ID=MMETSP0166-20121206/17154_1 /ASSEMBLY_ACC=CAM_ASM_000260 /TAXON_ID=95228 /ORGANISM="Vannella robusta, Strain DIVA3 518/3/11/1/6" /LENGTH=347 /DNA_ID=CAMNT_0053631325 /DNA_START=517 /DNA_END=1560 /DNA_ORIENTATION=-